MTNIILFCLQIGSSSHDSVPVPFHLLPGEWSLSPLCVTTIHEAFVFEGYQHIIYWHELIWDIDLLFAAGSHVKRHRELFILSISSPFTNIETRFIFTVLCWHHLVQFSVCLSHIFCLYFITQKLCFCAKRNQMPLLSAEKEIKLICRKQGPYYCVYLHV